MSRRRSTRIASCSLDASPSIAEVINETDLTTRSLLELPPEIRHYILCYCFCPPYPEMRTAQPGSGTNNSRQAKCTHQSLLLTCRTFRDECLEDYARTHIFRFKDAISFGKSLRSQLSTSPATHLRHISMDLFDNCSVCKDGNTGHQYVVVHPYHGLTVLDKLNRLVSLTKRYPELCNLDQLDIRRDTQRVDTRLLHWAATKIAEIFTLHLQTRGQSAYFVVRESCTWAAWVSIYKVSKELWKKIPHDGEERDKDCEYGCGLQGTHLCSKKEGQMVRSCEDLISQAQNNGHYTDSRSPGSSNASGAVRWKALRSVPWAWGV